MTSDTEDSSLYPQGWEVLIVLALTAFAAWPSTALAVERLAAWAAAVTFGAYLFQRIPLKKPRPEGGSNRDVAPAHVAPTHPPAPIGDFIENAIFGFHILVLFQGLAFAFWVFCIDLA